MTPEEAEPALLSMTRRRFLYLVGLTAAGAAVAAAVPGVAEGLTAAKDTVRHREPSPDSSPEEVPWERRRALMLRAHEDTVAYSREE